MPDFFIYGDNLRLVRNPNWPNRICDDSAVVHDPKQGRPFLHLLEAGEVIAILPIYQHLTDIPADFRPHLLTPILDREQGMQMFESAAAESAVTGRPIGHVLFDRLSASSQTVCIDGRWFLSDLITEVDDFYHESDIEIVRIKFFQQFVI